MIWYKIRLSQYPITGPFSYSDTGEIDNPATVTVLILNHWIEWQSLTVTLFRFPRTITVSDRGCITEANFPFRYSNRSTRSRSATSPRRSPTWTANWTLCRRCRSRGRTPTSSTAWAAPQTMSTTWSIPSSEESHPTSHSWAPLRWSTGLSKRNGAKFRELSQKLVCALACQFAWPHCGRKFSKRGHFFCTTMYLCKNVTWGGFFKLSSLVDSKISTQFVGWSSDFRVKEGLSCMFSRAATARKKHAT